MATSIPAFNPFPAQATTAVEEGPFLDSYRSWQQHTPTLQLDAVRRTTTFVARFQLAPKTAGRREGQAVFVHGEHGSGKTHAIRAAVGQVATEHTSVGPADDALFPLYVKLSSPNFVHAYRLLMAQVSLSYLTDVALKFLGSLSHGGPLPLRDSAAFQKNPSILLDMFNKHLLERGLLLQAQADRLQNVVRDESNFHRALIYLLEPDLQDAAFAWLQARPVPDSELRRLGISGPLETADQCRYGLQLLALLCDRANRPLVLILDQAEKFLAGPAGSLVVESCGFLHSLVESIPDIGGMLIVAASEETWSLLPADLRQRFGSNDVPCFPLQPSQAFELLGMYVLTVLDPAEQGFYRSAWPFTDAAVRTLLITSGGNVRALLQLAWQSFQDFAPPLECIGPENIPDSLLVLDRATVEMSVRRVLWGLGQLTINLQASFQFTVNLPGATRLMVRLSEAMFYLAEAERAEEDLLARVKAGMSGGDAGPAERHVLIVIGYASSEVQSLLRRVYDEVFVYRDSNTLDRALRDLLGSRHKRLEADEPDLSDLYGELAALGWSRTQSADQLTRGVRELNESYRADEADRRFQELVRRWPGEREATAQRIAAARRDRVDEQLGELNRLERVHLTNTMLLNACAAALLAIAGIAALRLPLGRTVPWLSWLGWTLSAVAVVMLAGSVLAGLHRSRALVPASLAEAERIARNRFFRNEVFSPLSRLGQIGRSLWTQASAWLHSRQLPDGQRTGSLPRALRSGDPYRRYGYLLTGAPDRSRHTLRAALNTERSGLIRRVLADRLGRRLLDKEPWGLVVGPTDNDIAELPYIVQHQHGGYWNEIGGLTEPARLLVALASRDHGGIRPGGRRSALEADRQQVVRGVHHTSEEPFAKPGTPGIRETNAAIIHILQAYEGRGMLGEAYRSGLSSEVFRRAAAETEDNVLRQATRLLSPIDGLGAHDHLQLAPEIEQLFLFFTQLLYLRDGGAVVN
ncbi:hypothetical protein MRQ36_22170 [Micromonospora sp. R77]|uniref:hypothetical protein n=1 Tax=Micromonospora sp. R77 TaxID=2925836 RepID=UPI001F611FD2|nr:hypothetical protein [Micromonospora sp. R77]MCI4065123.1 hypothetical protein [Micromonospora sp. R77]